MGKSTESPKRWRCFADRRDGLGIQEVKPKQLPELLDGGALLWVDILAPTKAGTDRLKRLFKFHPLALSDLLNDEVRPKNETYGPVLFTVFRALNLNPGADALDAVNLNMFLTDRFLVTTHSQPLRSVRNVLERVERDKSVLENGTAYVYYLLLDGVVDRYLELMDQMEDEIEELEDRIFGEDVDSVQESIFDLKKQLAKLRHRILPERDVLASLIRGDFPQIDEATRIHLRDVYDHIVRARDILEAQRDLLNSLRESYMTQLSHRMNEVMRLLSIIATVMLPLGFIAGVFGMNFDKIPMQHWENGFWALMVMMAVLVVAIVAIFKRFRLM